MRGSWTPLKGWWLCVAGGQPIARASQRPFNVLVTHPVPKGDTALRHCPLLCLVKTSLAWDSSLAGHTRFESLVQKENPAKLRNSWV